MAEACVQDVTLDRRSGKELLSRIIRLSESNSLDELKETFKVLQPHQCISILNSTLNGCTPLFMAIYYKRVNICRYLLELSLLQGAPQMCIHWKYTRHPFLAAIETGNPTLVDMILHYLPDINENISGPLTALMIAIFNHSLIAVTIIVARGADINQPSVNRRTPLMCSNADSEICSFLISRGAKVNLQDEDGFTALHLAVAWNRIENVTALVNAGADIKMPTHDGITPLLCTTIYVNHPIFEYLVKNPNYSTLERIEGLEIMNSSSVCDQQPYINSWKEALEMRRKYDLPKICKEPVDELLDHSQEFKTLSELENLLDDPLRLAFQGLLVVERIIGRNNRIYMQLVLQTALIAEKVDRMEKVKQLIDHIQEYCHRTSFVGTTLSFFGDVFSAIAKHSGLIFSENGGFAIFKIIARTAVKLWYRVKYDIQRYPLFVDRYYSDMVDSFLNMTAKSKTKLLDTPGFDQFRVEVQNVIKEDIRLMNYQSLLHRTIVMIEQEPVKLVELLRFLLESGADINSTDQLNKTPVMYVPEYVPENIGKDVLEIFAAYGCRPDF